MKCYFQTRQLCVGYPEKTLLREIDIGIDRGEILTLIGPNGVGKSTLLKSMAGQLRLHGGAVYLDGADISEMSGAQLSRKMAVVFTEKMQTELMTCEEVVATGRYPYTGYFGVLSKRDHAAVEEAMELVHVAGVRGEDFRKISDGQRQRVMLARAICQEPEIIIMDEPVTFLDIRYKLEFLSVLLKLREKKGLTVVMSLHELELAKIVSDKILCLKGGRAERFGTPAEIFEGDFIERLFDISGKDFPGDERLLAYVRGMGREKQLWQK